MERGRLQFELRHFLGSNLRRRRRCRRPRPLAVLIFCTISARSHQDSAPPSGHERQEENDVPGNEQDGGRDRQCFGQMRLVCDPHTMGQHVRTDRGGGGGGGGDYPPQKDHTARGVHD